MFVRFANHCTTITSAGVETTSAGNMLRSPITTRMRSRPSEMPLAGMASPENMPIRLS